MTVIKEADYDSMSLAELKAEKAQISEKIFELLDGDMDDPAVLKQIKELKERRKELELKISTSSVAKPSFTSNNSYNTVEPEPFKEPVSITIEDDDPDGLPDISFTSVASTVKPVSNIKISTPITPKYSNLSLSNCQQTQTPLTHQATLKEAVDTKYSRWDFPWSRNVKRRLTSFQTARIP